MLKANQDIRQAASDAGVKMWQIAYALGMHDSNFSCKLRRELSETEKSHIRSIIAELLNKQKQEAQI